MAAREAWTANVGTSPINPLMSKTPPCVRRDDVSKRQPAGPMGDFDLYR
jgi:hypothetical protein